MGDDAGQVGVDGEFASEGLESAFSQIVADAPETIWHYTDSAGLKGIIESGEIWATHLAHVNDASEMEYALAMLRDALRTVDLRSDRPEIIAASFDHFLTRNFTRVFAASFCEDGDLLSQWRGYASADGYSVGFDTRRLAAQLFRTGSAMVAPVSYDGDSARAATVRWAHEVDASWQSVFPQGLPAALKGAFGEGSAGQGERREEQAEFLARQVYEVSRKVGFLPLVSAFHKDPGFKEEREWRVASEVPDTTDPPYEIEVRSSPAGLVPYIRIPVLDSTDRSPLSAIRIGPGLDRDVQQDAIRMLLTRARHSDQVEVLSSVLPFRS